MGGSSTELRGPLDVAPVGKSGVVPEFALETKVKPVIRVILKALAKIRDNLVSHFTATRGGIVGIQVWVCAKKGQIDALHN